jgi:GTP-binding protein Era
MRKSGFVAIAGRPNAGKSTLLNSILGTTLSIATPKAQTTRERVNGVYTEKEGQMVFVDTPGIHKAKVGGINEYMMNEVKAALDEPDLVWYMVDPGTLPKHELPVIELLKKTGKPIFMIFNKLDIKSAQNNMCHLESALMRTIEESGLKITKIFKLSALKKRGVDELLQASWEVLPEGPFFFEDEDQLSDRPTRYFVSEKIREQLLLKLGDELPYSCAIQIEKFAEDAKPPRIEALIHVERDSQKGMVIGEGGKKIKEIGSAARGEIERFLGTKVFLGLNVKVTHEWSRNRETLKRLGYDLPQTSHRR